MCGLTVMYVFLMSVASLIAFCTYSMRGFPCRGIRGFSPSSLILVFFPPAIMSALILCIGFGHHCD